MYLQKLNILNYKNIAEAQFEFVPGVVCLVGGNGEGKTNLLDAVYYLSFCKSRTNSLAESYNMMHDASMMMLHGVFDREGIEETIDVGYKAGGHKTFKRGGKEYERLAAHIGLLPLVMVSPEDQDLLYDGSEARRKFMDSVIAQSDKLYLDKLVRYNRLLQQRNTMLKQELSDAGLYEVCEMQMEELSVYLYEKRTAFVKELCPLATNYYRQLSADKEAVKIVYRSHLQDGCMKAHWDYTRSRDLAVGYTTRGIHKDDLEMYLGDYLVRREGSQGQGKTFVLALKLAQYDFLRKSSGGIAPILMLDDVFDKLDATRVEALMKLVSGPGFGQIFITDTNRQHTDCLLASVTSNYQLYEVEGGGFKLLNV